MLRRIARSLQQTHQQSLQQSFRPSSGSRPSRWRRVRRLALAVVLCASGCTSAGIEVLYGQADMLAMGEVDKRLCPSKERKPEWERLIAQVLRWHKNSELPRYAKLMRQVAGALEGGVTRKEFDAVVATIDKTVNRTIKQVGKPAARVLAGVESREVTCFGRAIEESHAEALDAIKEQEADGYAKARLDAMLAPLERFAGDFSDEQKQTLRSKWSLDPEAARAELRRRRRNNERLLSLLELPAAKRGPGLVRALSRPNGLASAKDRAASAAAREQGLERVWDVVQVMSEAQRTKARESALELAEIFDRLAAR